MKEEFIARPKVATVLTNDSYKTIIRLHPNQKWQCKEWYGDIRCIYKCITLNISYIDFSRWFWFDLEEEV